ncbi:MAG TPA: BON domain-containing protein [Terriglobales bacterium]|nr:BON domain-containing protein [Terriglobales bacterium]
MKPRLLYFVSVIVLLTMLTSCDRFTALGGRSDTQIASDVQGKINGDSNVTNKQIGVTADHGVVTLSGNAGSDMERTAAGNDAGQVQGVKTVVNNIQVLSAANQPPTTSMGLNNDMGPSANQSVDTTTSRAGTTSTRVHRSRKPSPGSSYNDTSYNNDSGANTNMASNTTAAPAYTPPPPPAPVSIPEGTMLAVSLVDPLSSESNKTGETFRASLATPLVGDDGRMAVPAGSEVEGRIVDAKPSTHFSGSSNLTLELTRVTVGGKSYDIATNQWQKQGAGRGKRTAETIGAGAGVGALIGGLIGGGKGAAIGAGAGGAAGTGVQGVTHGEAVKLPSETRLDFRLTNPVTITPASASSRQRIPVNNTSNQ